MYDVVATLQENPANVIEVEKVRYNLLAVRTSAFELIRAG